MTEDAASFAVQCKYSLALAVLVLPDFGLAQVMLDGPLKVNSRDSYALILW